MTNAEAERPMTPHMLVGSIEKFIQDNRHSGLVEHRWLASYLGDILKIARQVRSGGMSSLDQEYQELAREFRLTELATEKSTREKQIAELDREARKLLAESPAKVA